MIGGSAALRGSNDRAHVIEIEESFVHSRIDRSSCSQLLSSPFGAPLIEMIETPLTGDRRA
jgi:hypothetical protein